MQAAVKHALAQFSITPTLDFDLDPNIQQIDAVSKPASDEKEGRAVASSLLLYQTFTQKNQAHFIEPTNKSELRHWKDFYEGPADKTGLAGDQAGGDSASPQGRSVAGGGAMTSLATPPRAWVPAAAGHWRNRGGELAGRPIDPYPAHRERAVATTAGHLYRDAHQPKLYPHPPAGGA